MAVIQLVIMKSRDIPVEFDGAKHRRVCYKKSASSKSSEETSVPRSLASCRQPKAATRESFWGAAPCRDAGVKINAEKGGDARNKLSSRMGCM